MSNNKNHRQRFIFEEVNARGELVRLNDEWRKFMAIHPYPDWIQTLIGELLTATILLSATIKFKGTLIAQLQSQGTVNLIIAESSTDNTFRGMAQYTENGSINDISSLFQKATLALTISPEDGERYQGIVDISGGNISHAIEDYMRRSQQLETRIWLAVEKDCAAGMLIQKLPQDEQTAFEEISNDNQEPWQTIIKFSETVKHEELLTENFQTLVRHLYPEFDVRLFDPIQLQFQCTCNIDKVKNMLRLLGEQEITTVIAEKGSVGVNCQFCNQRYDFDKVDIKELFATDIEVPHSDTQH